MLIVYMYNVKFLIDSSCSYQFFVHRLIYIHACVTQYDMQYTIYKTLTCILNYTFITLSFPPSIKRKSI